MTPKTITGKVLQVVDNEQLKSITIETEPAKAASGKDKATPATRLVINTTRHTDLEGVERGKTITITIS